MMTQRLLLSLFILVGIAISFTASASSLNAYGRNRVQIIPSAFVGAIERANNDDERIASFSVVRGIRFEQNSRQMYNEILEGYPRFLRSIVEKNMDKMIYNLCDDAIYESDLYNVVKRASPRPLLKLDLRILNNYQSKPAIVETVEGSNKSLETQGEGLRFEQNAGRMYEKILEETPGFIGKRVQGKIDGAIADLCEGVVSEKDM